MATFNYTVDTKPMADEIRSVSRHLNATTGAVTAMQAAVILAEENAADLVCNNVNRGFYSLIRSQISQKMAKLQSEVDSHLMQLVQQKNALLGIKNRMQKDYNMIATRYIKLFNELNANLKQRVFELDKPTIDFAVKEMDKAYNRPKYLTATIPIAQLESLTSSQKIIASNVKYRCLNAINSMRNFLQEMDTQKKLTDQILVRDSRYTETASVFIPIIVLEFQRDKTDSGVEIYVSDKELDNISRFAIKNTAFQEFSKMEWRPKSSPNTEIISEFNRYMLSSTKSKRVVSMAMKLFQSNNYQTN
jgi:hypothetical protein